MKSFKISSDLKTYISKIDILRSLIRYQNCLRNVNESVAEHSFYVAAIILKLYEYYNFDLETALVTALIHDIPECEISDIPHPIKERNKDLMEIVDRIEIKTITNILSEDAAELLKHFNDGDTIEGLICQLADILSVIIYASDELKSGNKVFNYIAIKSLNRVYEVTNKLETAIKEPYTKETISNIINQIVNIY